MSRATIAAILGFIGTICFVAIGYELLPGNIGSFLGILCYMASGLAWWLPVGRRKED